jgi:hypothetical protein
MKMQTIEKLKDYNFFFFTSHYQFSTFFFLNFQILIYFFNLLCKTQPGHGSGQANLRLNRGLEIRLGLMWLTQLMTSGEGSNSWLMQSFAAHGSRFQKIQ